MSALLPIHGFVLAGGKSSRMGEDKALLKVNGQTMIEIAASKLSAICTAVSVAGNRADLSGFAEVASEQRDAIGPVAGIEAGLIASREPWAMFVPVDAPLVPTALLHAWMAAVLEKQPAGCGASFLLVNGHREPTFCVVRREYAQVASRLVDEGERRIASLLYGLDEDDSHGWLWPVDAARFAAAPTELQMETWFMNVNTREDLVEAKAWAAHLEEQKPVTY